MGEQVFICLNGLPFEVNNNNNNSNNNNKDIIRIYQYYCLLTKYLEYGLYWDIF